MRYILPPFLGVAGNYEGQVKTFKDKVAVVTGAAGGIGRALVKAFTAQGMQVVMAGINAERLTIAADEFRKKGSDVFVIETDVSRADQVAALAEKTIARYGAVHLLCNNAGVSYNRPSISISKCSLKHRNSMIPMLTPLSKNWKTPAISM